jgi:Ca2+-transporting ATPase
MDKKQGLTSKEVERRLERFGPNILPEKSPPSSVAIFVSQFKNPLVYVLLFAGVVTFFLGEYADMAIIFFVVFINSILGFVQEKKASSALQALKAMVHPTADVVRDGEKMTIDVEKVVPGDIVELEQGDKVAADGELIDVNRLFIEEAILTGESMPIEKSDGDEAYMGTVVSSGKALMKVSATGEDTQMGKIAESVQKPDEDTPLTKQLKIFSNQLTIVVVILTISVFIIGILTDKGIFEMFETSVALAVSSIPEGLLIALTAVLAVGMQRILRKQGLVRNLVSAETLGGVTTICVDKTGTLTQGKLKVVNDYGENKKICIKHYASSDDPIMLAAMNWLKEHDEHSKELGKAVNKECRVLDSIPFTSENRFYATLIEHKDGNKEIYINGAPETVLKWSNLGKEEIKKNKALIKELTRKGRRVIATAKKNVSEKYTKLSEKDVQSKLEWVGILVFTDPVRKDVGRAFKETEEAGIETIVITGDYAETALAVMREVNFDVDEKRVIKGNALEKMSVSEVAKRLGSLYRSGKEAVLFARTRPEQKLKVINALKKNGEVVAMTGDGVNDAPALHRADIGIVVGEATEVAKESADLVLLDSSFETIVEAVREGRGIFDNIRKIILYLLSDSFEEIVAVVLTLIFHLPLPVTAAQILWINIISDGFPHLSLTVDPKEKGIMKRPPRVPGTNIVANWMKLLIVIVSASGGVIAFLLFVYYMVTTGDEEAARSVAFATLGINSLIYVFSVRTLTDPFWVENPLDNKWLNVAVLVGIFFQILPFTNVHLRHFFELRVLTVGEWIMVFAASFAMFLIIEVTKLVYRVESIKGHKG